MFAINGALYSMTLDASLDKIIRSSDPSLKRQVEERVRCVIHRIGTPISRMLACHDFATFAQDYGEQYVADPVSDLDQYFDIVNGRLFSRSIPTQMAVLYLFGTGKHYRPNVSALSSAGEGIAGFLMEHFGYRPLVRPLGVTPDAVLWTQRAGTNSLAMMEAKASVSQDPQTLIEKNAAQFFVDIKTRAVGFGFRYEAYLIASLFKDGRRVDCACLHVDLARYSEHRRFQKEPSEKTALEGWGELDATVTSYTDPDARLRSIIRLHGEIVDTNDEYLTALLSEEATRTTLVLMLKGGREPGSPSEIDEHINSVANELGCGPAWTRGQKLLGDLKARERREVRTALDRYHRGAPEIE